MISVINCINYLIFIPLFIGLQATQINLDESSHCKDLQPDCGGETAKCFKKQFRSQMFQHCRRTCRLCVPPGFDNYFRNDESLESVDQKKSIALKPNVLARPKRQVEIGAKCGDLGPDCLLYTNFCTNQFYLGFMMNHCPLSCGFCDTNSVRNEVGASPTRASCKDVVEECDELGRIGFCESDEQSTEIKRTLCAATCKLCLRFSVTTLNSSIGSLTSGNSSGTAVAVVNKTNSPEQDTAQPVVIVGQRVQPATDENALCIDKDVRICRKIQEKCTDKDFFDYLKIFCSATCDLCGQRKIRTNLIPSVQDRALQFIRRQRVGDEPKRIRGCIDKYEKCDELISTKGFCENTSGRFLCKASCSYCRPLPITVVVSERTNSKKTSAVRSTEEEEEVKDVSVVDNKTSRPKSDGPKFTELIIPRSKGNGRPTIIKIPGKLNDEDNEQDKDVLDGKSKRKGSKDVIDIDESLGDVTIEELLSAEKLKEAQQQLEEEARGLPLSFRRLLARSRNQHRTPLLKNFLALRRRRLINHLLNDGGRFVNNSHLTDASIAPFSPETAENTSDDEEETVELPLTDSLEELFTSSKLSTTENSDEEEVEEPQQNPEKSSPNVETQKEPKLTTKTSFKDPKPKRRTIILINNGIQTVENARVKPKKTINKSIVKEGGSPVEVLPSKFSTKNNSKASQRKANRAVRVILKKKLSRDAAHIVNRASEQPPSRRRHDDFAKIVSSNKTGSSLNEKESATKQVKPAKTKSKATKSNNSDRQIVFSFKEKPRKNSKKKEDAIEKPKRGRPSKRKSKKRDSDGRKRIAELLQNSQLAPKLASQKVEEIVDRIQTEATLNLQQQSSHLNQSAHNLSSQVAKFEEEQQQQSNQPAPHQTHLVTPIRQSDQIIPSLNVPQNQANLFGPTEVGQISEKRLKRALLSHKKTEIGSSKRSEEVKEGVEPKENWLKKQFDNDSHEETTYSASRNHLQPVDTSDTLLSTAISSIQVVQPYPKEEVKSNENEKKGKLSIGKEERHSKKSVNSPSTTENKLSDSQIAEKKQPKIVEPKENWLKKQFEDKSKDDNNKPLDWEGSQVGSNNIENDSFESSLFPVLEKAPWRPSANHLKKKQNQ